MVKEQSMYDLSNSNDSSVTLKQVDARCHGQQLWQGWKGEQLDIASCLLIKWTQVGGGKGGEGRNGKDAAPMSPKMHL